MRLRTRLFVVAILGCLTSVSCTEAPPIGENDNDRDGSADLDDCQPNDPAVHPGAIDTCDGVDSDCDGVVDSDPSVVHQDVQADADGDGWGNPYRVDVGSCLRPGWVAVAPEYDCDDDAPAANPEHPGLCDVDHDGVLASVDCDDLDVFVYPDAPERCNEVDDDCDGLVDDADPDTALEPTTPMYGLDADHDGHTALATIAGCVLPGPDYAFVGGDCDDADETVNPSVLDDCATQTDRDCSGTFEPVSGRGVEVGATGTPQPISELFLRAGPSDEPTVIQVHGAIHVCPGTYRVRFQFGGFSIASHYGALIGRGDSPDDVVFDAGGAGRSARIETWGDLDQDGPTDVDIEGVTFKGGTSEQSGGCLELESGWSGPNTVDLDAVVFTGCAAPRGGAVHVASDASLVATDVSFVDCHASVAGGAISVDGGQFAMSGGGFATCTAPAGHGAAVSVGLTATNGAGFALVDFGAVTDDVLVTFGDATYMHELAASASVVFDAAHPDGL